MKYNSRYTIMQYRNVTKLLQHVVRISEICRQLDISETTVYGIKSVYDRFVEVKKFDPEFSQFENANND